ncbi:MAG: hypothetical protein EOM10_16635, partial [Opitutae bacterium]|nr:hypothetical protein [Opitutae bacterium]
MYLVIAATPFELDPLLRACPPGVRFEPLVCGVGPVETALRLGVLLARREAAGAPRYRGVINIGVAGAYRRAEGCADLLDLCLAEREVLGDLGICDEETITSLRSDTLEILDTFDLDGPLLVEAEDVLAACGLAVRCGTFVTVNCVSATSRRGDQLASRHNALCVSPRFSPDGNFLAYSTYHRGNQDLYITDLRQNKTTSALSRRKGLNLAPAFANDGRTMVVTLSKGGTPDLYTIDRKGNIIEQLTSHAGINVSPSFSPDGQSMAFVSDRSGKPNVYVMNMASRQVQRLTFKNSENSEPAWSPKGDEIAFTGLQGGTYQLFVMDR